MRHRAQILAGIAALLAAPAAAQVSDYRLPPAPTPTPTPRIVGPVLGTPTPRPSPAPTPVPTPPPTVALTPAPTPAPRVTLPRAAPAPRATPTPSAAIHSPAARLTIAAPAPAPAPTPSPVPATTTPPSAPAPSLSAIPTLRPAPTATGTHSWWPWIAALLVLAGAAAGALLWLRRRIGPIGQVAVPQIERPKLPDVLDLEPYAVPAAEASPLQIAVELRKLTITLLNATLGYRLTLTNGGPEPLEDIAVAADLVGAHSSLPREMQLAGAGTQLPEQHRLAGLAPGESGELKGDLRLPLNQVTPIAQGRSLLFVPLARFRITARGHEPRWFTLIAGQPSPGGTGTVQPVRLDLGPRIYDGLAGRAF